MIFNYDVSELQTAITNATNLVAINSISDLSMRTSRYVNFGTALNVGGVTIPQYSRGLVISNSVVAVLYATNSTGHFYVANRNADGDWVNGSDLVGNIAALADTSSAGSSSGYNKMADGTLVQWGQTSFHLESNMTQIGSTGVYYYTYSFTLPVAFSSTLYTLTGTSRYSTGHCVSFGAINNTGNTATIHVYDYVARTAGTTNSVVLRWQAVGRWK